MHDSGLIKISGKTAFLLIQAEIYQNRNHVSNEMLDIFTIFGNKVLL